MSIYQTLFVLNVYEIWERTLLHYQNFFNHKERFTVWRAASFTSAERHFLNRVSGLFHLRQLMVPLTICSEEMPFLQYLSALEHGITETVLVEKPWVTTFASFEL